MLDCRAHLVRSGHSGGNPSISTSTSTLTPPKEMEDPTNPQDEDVGDYDEPRPSPFQDQRKEEFFSKLGIMGQAGLGASWVGEGIEGNLWKELEDAKNRTWPIDDEEAIGLPEIEQKMSSVDRDKEEGVEGEEQHQDQEHILQVDREFEIKLELKEKKCDDDDEDDCPLYSRILRNQVMFEHLAWEYYRADMELTRARQLLRENNIPFGDTEDEGDDGHPSGSGSQSPIPKSDEPTTMTIKKSSGWKTVFLRSLKGLSVLLMILILVKGIRSSMRNNACLNPFYFKSADDYLSYCGSRIQVEPPPI